MRKSLPAFVLVLLVLGFAAPSQAQQVTDQSRSSACSVVNQPSPKVFGDMDDAAPASLVAGSCFNVVKKTVWLTPTNWHLADLSPVYLAQLDQQMNDAASQNLKVIFELWMRVKGTAAMPLSPSQQRGVCDVGTDLATKYPAQTLGIEIGVEPNSATFWQPQFGPDGTNASAGAYESWLATCYQRIKAVHPNVMVIGGALASHGNDDPSQGINRASTSPVVFIAKLCDTYRSSGDTQPLMDWIDIHSYQDNSSQPPSTVHPYPSMTITIADYAKLEGLLQCFTGTAQPVPKILWGEAGYDSQVPPGQQARYSGNENPAVMPVDEATQGADIAAEINMAYCQPESVGFINFLLIDQAVLGSWQSGLYYAIPATGSPGGYPLAAKQSLLTVESALQSAEAQTMQC